MSLDRHECELHLDWLAEAFNRKMVILVSSALQGRPGIDGKRGLPAKDVRNIFI